MPGLFGIVVDPRRESDVHLAENALSRMGDSLVHQPHESVERWTSREGGLFIGRAGGDYMCRARWAAEQQAADSRRYTFVSGVLHSPPPSVTDDPIDSLAQLRGFFAAAFHVTFPASTLIAADRRSAIPIYYAQMKGVVMFAPEVKAILAGLGAKASVDLEAMATFVACGHLLSDQTLAKSVRRLRGGECLLVREGELSIRRYWEFRPGSRAEKTSEQELEHELAHLIDNAVGKNLGRPDRTVIFLSGGGDSRGVLGGALTAVEGNGTTLNSVTWLAADAATPPAELSDAGKAGAIARAYKLNHRYLERSIESYGRHFSIVNDLLDAQSEVAAEHPYEYQLMLDLREDGFERVLRGDQAFGRGICVYDHDQAAVEAGLRRLRHLDGILRYMNRGVAATLIEASDAAMDMAVREVAEHAPNDAKDRLYFEHRLQVCLNSAAYFKQVALDARNPLLDEEILDFMEVVPARLRVKKRLYWRALARRYPDLWSIGLAEESGLENWPRLLAMDSPVRRFATEQLGDRDSEIWTYFDRAALCQMLSALGHRQRRLAKFRRAVLRSTTRALPDRAQAALQIDRKLKYQPAHKALFRVLVLKMWMDRYT